MRLVYGDDAAVAAWVAERIPEMAGAPGFGPSVAIGVMDGNGHAAAGVVFHNYQQRYKSIDVSCAAVSRRWLTRDVATRIFAYPFKQLGVQRVTAITAKRNHATRVFLEVFGFRREGVAKLGFGDDDAVLMRLMADEWASNRFNLLRDPAQPVTVFNSSMRRAKRAIPAKAA